MAFLRAKSANDRVYLSLVENRWDARAGYPRQRVLRYLGPLEGVRVDDLPAPHRTPKIESSLARLQASLEARRAPVEAAAAEGLFLALLGGDLAAARIAAHAVVRSGGLNRFYGRTLPDVFQRIGEGWRTGRISIAREHVATAIAAHLVEGLNATLPDRRSGAPEVILCVPEGETHTLALVLAEGLLRRGGFRPTNLAGTAPTAAVVAFVVERQPKVVLISVTQPIYLGAAGALANRLKAACPSVRVVLGGQGVAAWTGSETRRGAEIVRHSLAEFLEGMRPGVFGRDPRPQPPTGRSARLAAGAATR